MFLSSDLPLHIKSLCLRPRPTAVSRRASPWALPVASPFLCGASLIWVSNLHSGFRASLCQLGAKNSAAIHHLHVAFRTRMCSHVSDWIQTRQKKTQRKSSLGVPQRVIVAPSSPFPLWHFHVTICRSSEQPRSYARFCLIFLPKNWPPRQKLFLGSFLDVFWNIPQKTQSENFARVLPWI